MPIHTFRRNIYDFFPSPASLQIRSYGQHSPVHSAAGYGKVDILKYLLDVQSFSFNSFLRVDNNQRISCLQWAIYHNKEVVSTCIYKNRCRIVLPQRCYLSPHDLFQNCVKVLLDHGADVFVEGFWWRLGGDARTFAEAKGNKVIIKMVKQVQDREERGQKEEVSEAAAAAASTPVAGISKTPSSSSVASDSAKEGPDSSGTWNNAKGTTGEASEDISVESRLHEEDKYAASVASSSAVSWSTASSSSTSAASSTASTSLIEELTRVIRSKVRERRKELREARKVDRSMAFLQAQLRKLHACGEYRSEEQKGAIEKDLKDLEAKMERVRLALLHTEGEGAMTTTTTAEMETVTDEEEEEGDGSPSSSTTIVQCVCCLTQPGGEVRECRRCDSVVCPKCLVGKTECPICRVSLGANPPRRNRFAERLIEKTSRRRTGRPAAAVVLD